MKKGLSLAVITAVISGISIFTNGLFVTKFNPVLFALFRNLLVALILSGYLAISNKKSELKTLSKSNWIKLVLIGLVGGGIPFALFFNGLSLIGSTTANIINKSLFLWVAVLAVTLLKEKLHWVSVIGYGILFFALFWGSKITISGGLLLVLAATLFWAVEHVIAKITLKNVSPLVVSWSRMIFGLPVLAIISLFTGKTQIGLTQPVFLSLLVSAGFLIIYMLSWYSSIKAASVSLVASVLVLAPVITLILNTLVNHKPLQIPNLITSGLTILGIFLIVIPGIRKSASRKLPYGV